MGAPCLACARGRNSVGTGEALSDRLRESPMTPTTCHVAGRPSESHHLSHGFAAPDERARPRFVDDADLRGALDVAVIEPAAGEHRQPERREERIVHRDFVNHDSRAERLLAGVNKRASTMVRQRQRRCGRRARHAGHGANTLEERPLVRRQPITLVADRRGIDTERHEAVRVESRVDRQDVEQAAAEQRRGAEERDRQRHLQDDEASPQAEGGPGAFGEGPAGCEHVVRGPPGQEEGGREPDQQAGRHRHDRREHDHARVGPRVDTREIAAQSEERGHERSGPVCEHDPGRPGRDGERGAFDQARPEQIPPPGSQSEAHSRLVRTHDAARQQQVGDVARGDDQHERGHGHQQLEGEVEVPGQSRFLAADRARRLDADRVCLEEDAVLLVAYLRAAGQGLVEQTLVEQPDRRLGPLAARTWPQSRHHGVDGEIRRIPGELAHRPRHDLVAHAERQEQLGDGADAGPRVAGREDADDGDWDVVHADRPADDPLVPAELAHPEAVVEDDHRRTVALLGFRGRERPSDDRPQAENSEVTGVDQLAPHFNRGVGRQCEPPASPNGNGAEDVRQAVPQRCDQRVVHSERPAAARADHDSLAGREARERRRAHEDELVGLLDGERPHRNPVDEREDGGVRADGEAEGQDDEQRDGRHAAEAAETDPQITTDVHEDVPPGRKNLRRVVGH